MNRLVEDDLTESSERGGGMASPAQQQPLPAEAIRQSGFRHAAGNFHRNMQEAADTVGSLLVDVFHILALFAIGATTVWSGATAFAGMIAQGRANLGDILLLFIYLEIGAMVGIYFKTTKLPVQYLIYIAMTALGRVLIEIVGAEHRTGMDILIITSAILLLSLAVLVLRFGIGQSSYDGQAADPKLKSSLVNSTDNSRPSR
jgi:phosphate starvation-inducible membrane PsiE